MEIKVFGTQGTELFLCVLRTRERANHCVEWQLNCERDARRHNWLFVYVKLLWMFAFELGFFLFFYIFNKIVERVPFFVCVCFWKKTNLTGIRCEKLSVVYLKKISILRNLYLVYIIIMCFCSVFINYKSVLCNMNEWRKIKNKIAIDKDSSNYISSSKWPNGDAVTCDIITNWLIVFSLSDDDLVIRVNWLVFFFFF